MFLPSGAALRNVAWMRQSRNNSGASAAAAPFAQSTSTRKPAQIGADILRQPCDVGVAQFRLPGQARRKLEGRIHVGFGVLQQGKNFLFDGDLMRVRQLVAVAGEDLDAIVGPGIVRRRDHHAGRVLARARQVGDARAW